MTEEQKKKTAQLDIHGRYFLSGVKASIKTLLEIAKNNGQPFIKVSLLEKILLTLDADMVETMLEIMHEKNSI